MNRFISALCVLTVVALSASANATYLDSSENKKSEKGEPWCLCHYSSPKTATPPDQYRYGICSARTCGDGEIRRAPEGAAKMSGKEAVDISNIGNAVPEGGAKAGSAAPHGGASGGVPPRVDASAKGAPPVTQKGAGSPKQPGF